MFSLIVLNYNGDELLRECLESIAAQSDRDFELLLIDNASTIPWRHALPASLQNQTVVLENESNLGYAEGNNVAIRRARGTWVVLLNNDAALEPDFLAQARRMISEHPGYRMFAPQIVVRDAREIIDSAGVGVFLDGTSRCRGWQESRRAYQQPAEVLGPVGSVAIYHREIFSEVGLLDPDFFCYLEDSDLLLRAQWMGYRALYCPVLRAFHSKSSTLGVATPQKAYLVERNRIWVAVKNFPLSLLLLSPLITFFRYALQACAAAFDMGIAGRFVRSYAWFQLPGILFHAYRDAGVLLPSMIRKRREIHRTRRVSRLRYLAMLWRFRLTWRDFALKE